MHCKVCTKEWGTVCLVALLFFFVEIFPDQLYGMIFVLFVLWEGCAAHVVYGARSAWRTHQVCGPRRLCGAHRQDGVRSGIQRQGSVYAVASQETLWPRSCSWTRVCGLDESLNAIRLDACIKESKRKGFWNWWCFTFYIHISRLIFHHFSCTRALNVDEIVLKTRLWFILCTVEICWLWLSHLKISYVIMKAFKCLFIVSTGNVDQKPHPEVTTFIIT